MSAPSVNLFHAVAVAPALGYIGYQSYHGQPLGANFGIFLMILAIILAVYHLSLYQRKTVALAKSSSGLASSSMSSLTSTTATASKE
jgi:hypothetical protein